MYILYIYKCVYVYIILFPFFRQRRKLLANYRERNKDKQKEMQRSEQMKKKPPVKYNNMKQLTKWNC